MLVAVCAAILCPSGHPAVPPAYLDPGSGSLIIQATLAAALSVPFIMRSKVRAFWARLRRRQPTPGNRGDAPGRDRAS
jgi:hypothetical protein